MRVLLHRRGQRAERGAAGGEAAADRRDRAGGLGLKTRVAIVGAGPAGLLLAHLLHRRGVASVVLEARSREYVEQRVRAGVLEQGTVDCLIREGVGERLRREGLVHHGIELRFGGRGHRIALSDLTGGRAITVYGQQEVVKDLIAARLETGEPLLFGVEDVRLDVDAPAVRFRHDGAEHALRCEAIAGCDGAHGVSRDALPARTLTRDYPFGWLGILATVAPSTEELIYARHERGFALHSLRTPELSRLYLQVDPDDDIEAWPDDRIWAELHARFATDDGWTLREGPVIEKAITPMKATVVEPMQHGPLFLAGDAAHIVPPTGAKGLNLAVHDVQVLADALTSGDTSGYTARCLERVWRVQQFSWWMTAMLHRFPGEDEVEDRLQRAQLDYVAASPAAATMLAENYVGLP